jgi:Arc/MetJ family transcription regulator
MKTTIELDETLLLRVMELAGVQTRREAIDLALRETERHLSRRALLAESIYAGVEEGEVVLDEDYDHKALRGRTSHA